jgi:hypothetical protein
MKLGSLKARSALELVERNHRFGPYSQVVPRTERDDLPFWCRWMWPSKFCGAWHTL